MNIVALVRYAIVVLAASFCLNFSSLSHAQPAPTASHLAAAKELVDLVGAAREFDPLVTGVIIQSASNYLQGNPSMAKDLNEIAEQLVTEYLPRKAEIPNEVVRLYASRLTEKEIRDVLAFYKSPLGQKMLTESQYVIGEAIKKADAFSAKLRQEVAARVRAELIKRGHKL
jgi:uncharacterized protein